jgi:hypothetical protein
MSLLIALYPFRLTASHRITASFEPEEFLPAVNDYSRKGFEVIQVRIGKRAIRHYGICDWIRGPVRDRKVAVPDSRRSAAVAMAVEGGDAADAAELRKAPSGKLSLLLESVGPDQTCVRARPGVRRRPYQ